MQIILASASQRRFEFFNSFNLKFKVVTSQVDEGGYKVKFADPYELVTKLAWVKVQDVKNKLSGGDYLIVAADTVIAINDGKKVQIIGKPKNRKEATKILRLLRGKKHLVITCVALLNSKGKKEIITDTTKVYFNDFTDNTMNDYLDTGVYLDRAGAYGIQDPKCDFVKKYKGSYNNILGLPTEKLQSILPKFGVIIRK